MLASFPANMLNQFSTPLGIPSRFSLFPSRSSFMGPLAVGVALDLAGGVRHPAAWIWAFAAMGAGSAVGLILVRWVAPDPADAPPGGQR